MRPVCSVRVCANRTLGPSQPWFACRKVERLIFVLQNIEIITMQSKAVIKPQIYCGITNHKSNKGNGLF